MKAFRLGLNAPNLPLWAHCPDAGLCVDSHLLKEESSLMWVK